MDEFNRPTPGFGLTQAVGSMPFEQAPLYTDIEMYSEDMFEMFTSEEGGSRLLYALEIGAPVDTTVYALLMKEISSGRISIDMAMLMAERLITMFVAIAQRGGLKEVRLTLEKDETIALTEIDEPEEVTELAEDIVDFLGEDEEASMEFEEKNPEAEEIASFIEEIQ